MSAKGIDELRRKLAGRLNEVAAGSAYGTVKKVDEEARTCDVEVGGIIREKVLLYFLDDEEKWGWWYVPKVGSLVLVTRVDAAGTRLRISMFSEIDKVVCTIGEEKTVFTITENGFRLNNGESGLLKTLTDLCAALEKLTVTTAWGPSGTPINAAEFTRIKQDLKTYLEG